MARAEKIEEFIRECFEMYGLDYEEFADSSADVRNNPKKFLEIKDGLNMYGVTEAAKVLGVSPEALLNMDEDAAAKWYKKYPYFFHITGFDQAYRRSFHDDSYDTIRLLEVLFNKKPCAPTRYNYDDVLRRLISLLKEIDKSIPGTYHEDAEMTKIGIYTENFCHYEKIAELVESYITMVKRAEELFLKALIMELSIEEIHEYNFLVSTVGIEDQVGHGYGFLYYDLLKKFIPVYQEEGYADFFSYVRISPLRAPKLWRCAEFASNKDLVQRFVEVYPRAKPLMRDFAMQVSKFSCQFTWSDAEPVRFSPEEEAELDDFDRMLGNEPLSEENRAKVQTLVYVPKTAAELNGNNQFADMLRVLSGPVKLGGVALPDRAADKLSNTERIGRVQTRVAAVHRSSKEVPHE